MTFPSRTCRILCTARLDRSVSAHLECNVAHASVCSEPSSASPLGVSNDARLPLIALRSSWLSLAEPLCRPAAAVLLCMGLFFIFFAERGPRRPSEEGRERGPRIRLRSPRGRCDGQATGPVANATGPFLLVPVAREGRDVGRVKERLELRS